MSIRVHLSEIVGGMQMQSDEFTAYLHRATGRIVMVSHDGFEAAEEEDDEDAVEPGELADARDILARPEEYLALPDRFEIDEYRMMERFALGLEDAEVRDVALTALSGAGAFRRFKDTMDRYGLARPWYAHRDAEYLEVARTWCEINGIEHDPAPASHPNGSGLHLTSRRRSVTPL